MNEFDVVICTALKDCNVLKKSIFYIRKNISPQNIYIITDVRNFRRFNLIKDIILIDENKLLPDLTFSKVKATIDDHLINKGYGWYFQQFLKMGFALSEYAKKKYLIWDADTIPLNEITFFKDDRHILTAKKEYHKAYFDTLERLIGYKKEFEKSFISEHMMVDVDIMKELIAQIENNKQIKGEKWFDKCIYAIDKEEKNGFSEFETYGTYCIVNYPSLIETRTIQTYRGGSKIFSIYFNSDNLDELAKEFDTISFEVNQFPIGGGKRIRQKIHYFRCKIIMKLRYSTKFIFFK